MKHEHPLANAELSTSHRPFVSELPKLRKMITALYLTGLANDTKWNELITHMRNRSTMEWTPMYRFNCIGSEYVSNWDCEWWHHLPFPFISVQWFEITYFDTLFKGHLLDSEIIDHSPEIEGLLSSIGFDYEKGNDAFRIFGYAPKDYTDFKT